MAQFKYGLQLLLWTEFFRRENIGLIKKAKDLGFDGVEVLLNDPDTFPVQEAKQALKEHDMGINFAVVLGEDTNSISPDEQVRNNAQKFMTKCIDTACAVTGGGCGIGGVNYAGWGYFSGSQRTGQEWEWAVSYYKQAAKYAAEKNITLCVEPVNRFETHFMNVAKDGVQFCKDTGEPNVKVHLDAYHMIREEKDFYQPIVDTGKYLGYFHACENERGIPGTGLVNWEEVYRGLKDAGYKGWITIESFTPDIKSIARLTAIWRQHAPSADALAGEGLKNLKEIEKNILGG
ncbi:MAG: sugar phosphate isomerase/epimerase family protein [Spirochaetota bacterium]